MEKQTPVERRTAFEASFAAALKKFRGSGHGTEVFGDIGLLLKGQFKKTRQVLAYLGELGFFREPVCFDDVPNSHWERHSAGKEPMRFPFLQGDLIQSGSVTAPQDILVPDPAYWQVLSRDCDTYKAAWLRVAPVYPLDESDVSRATMRQGVFFSTPNIFAMPPVGEAVGSPPLYSDFTVPFFIRQASGKEGQHMGTPIASLTPVGWDLLCAVLAANANRLENIAESVDLRSLPELEG